MPIITYAAETWNNNGEHTKALNRILDNIIKRTLQTPTSTPREALYMETGLIDIEHQSKTKQVMMKHRIKDNASQLMKTAIDAGVKGGWKERLNNLEQAMQLDENDYSKTKHCLKREVSLKINKMFKEKIEKDAQDKSKVQHLKTGQPEWEPGKMKEYLYSMPRKQASTIFKARSRMLKVKTNYKNKYKNNLKCRACGLIDETQNHVLDECLKLHTDDNSRVKPENIFAKMTADLCRTALRILATLTRLETFDKPSGILLQSDGRAQTPPGGMALYEARSSGMAQRPGTTAS